MGIVLESVGSVAVLRPEERVDVETAPEFDEAVRGLLDGGVRHLVVDLSETGYVSSGGLGAFLKAARLARAREAHLALAALSEQVTKVFQAARLLALFEVHPTCRAALAAFGDAASVGAPPPVPAANRGGDAAPPPADPLLTLPEEILLLALHDEDGRFIEVPDHALDHALAGAVLMELCIRRHVDSDLERLTVVDASPVGDDVLDPVLKALSGAKETLGAERWIEILARDAPEIRRRVLDRLVARGILRRDRNKLMWALGRRRYPVVDDTEQREVKARVMGIITSDEIPDPRDVVIIALAEACAVFDAMLDLDTMSEVRPRILEIASMDLIAQAMVRSIVAAQAADRAGGVHEIRVFSTLADGVWAP